MVLGEVLDTLEEGIAEVRVLKDAVARAAPKEPTSSALSLLASQALKHHTGLCHMQQPTPLHMCPAHATRGHAPRGIQAQPFGMTRNDAVTNRFFQFCQQNRLDNRGLSLAQTDHRLLGLPEVHCQRQVKVEVQALDQKLHS